eukprot:378290-Pyramimonas_sp.AAC.1
MAASSEDALESLEGLGKTSECLQTPWLPVQFHEHPHEAGRKADGLCLFDELGRVNHLKALNHIQQN